jgi:hypothetical protein
MTTKEKLIQELTKRGLPKEKAEIIFELGKPEIEKVDPNYRITWDRPAKEYPEELYHLWFRTIKPTASKWIEANIPNAWFKEIFK